MTKFKKTIIVSKNRILHRLPKEVDRGSVCYYLCDDYSAHLEIKKKYNNNLDIRLLGQKFHKVIEEITYKFLLLSSKINKRNASYAFWGTHIASRNSGTIPLLKHIAYFQCAKKIIDQVDSQILFVCDSPAMARLIKEEITVKGMECKIYLTFLEYLKPIYRYFRIIAKASYFLLSGVLLWIFSRLLKNRRITNMPDIERCVLRSWVTRGSIDENGHYHDRNFGILPEFLAKQNKDVWTIPLYFNLDRNIFFQMQLMSKSGYQFIFPEQYLSLLDIVKTLCDGIRGLFLNLNECEFDGYDIRSLILEIHRSACLQPLLLSSNSIRYLLKKFSRQNIHIDQFIYAFENNPSEKSFLLGIRQYYSGSSVFGFQHSVWLKEQLGGFLLPEEISYYPLPDKIIYSGSKYEIILKEAGFPQGILTPGPNLRYTTVNQNQKTNQLIRSDGVRKILIILNYETNHNFELLDKAGKALNQIEGIEVCIKAHPASPIKQIDAFLRSIDFPAYKWANGTVQEWVLKSDIVFMTGGSVSNLETIATGVPLIRISLENNFDFDCLWDEYPFATFTSSVKEISYNLEKAFKISSKERESLLAFGKEIIRNYFEPITQDNLKVFL